MNKKVSIKKFNQQFLSKTQFRPLSPQASLSSSQVLSIWTPQLKALFDQKQRTQINKLIFNLLQLREQEQQRSKLLKKSLQQAQFIIKKYEKERRVLVQTNNQIYDQLRQCDQLKSNHVHLQLAHSRALKNIQIILTLVKQKHLGLEELLLQQQFNPFQQDLKNIFIGAKEHAHSSLKHSSSQTPANGLHDSATLTQNDYLQDCQTADEIIQEVIESAGVRGIGNAIQMDSEFKISRTAHKIKLLFCTFNQTKNKLAALQTSHSEISRQLKQCNQKYSELALRFKASQMANTSSKEVINQLQRRLKSTNKQENKNQRMKSQISQQLSHLDKQLNLDVFGGKQSEISNQVNRLVGQKLNYINYIYQKKIQALENSLNEANDQIQELINSNKLSESLNAVLSEELRGKQSTLRSIEQSVRGAKTESGWESELLKQLQQKLKADQRQY